MAHTKKILPVIIAAAIAATISACGNSDSIASITQGTSAPLSEKRQSINTQEAEDRYRVFLLGNHTATLKDSTESYEFDFSDDGSFFGHSTAEEDDFGKYSMQFDEDQHPYLVIKCDDATDKYRLYIDDNNVVTLDSETQGTFTLLPAE